MKISVACTRREFMRLSVGALAMLCGACGRSGDTEQPTTSVRDFMHELTMVAETYTPTAVTDNPDQTHVLIKSVPPKISW